MTRTLIVEADKDFRITIPADAKVTFGPFSPPGKADDRYNPRSEGRAKGTLRVYEGGKTKATESILACFTGVYGFRDVSRIEFAEKVAVEEGATVWKSDQNGYQREEKVKRAEAWAEYGPDGLLTTKETDDDEVDGGF